MGIENMQTGEIDPIDICRDCLFMATINAPQKQINFDDYDEKGQLKYSQLMKDLFLTVEKNLQNASAPSRFTNEKIIIRLPAK